MSEPMFVHSPTAEKVGLHSQALVSSLDMTPTALDWAEVKYPNYSIFGHVREHCLGGLLVEGFLAMHIKKENHQVTQYSLAKFFPESVLIAPATPAPIGQLNTSALVSDLLLPLLCIVKS